MSAPSAPRTLPIVVTVPAAPSWLVSRSIVSCGYLLGSVPHSGGTQEFDFNGGTFQGTLESDQLGLFPATVKVDISVQYTAESGLPDLVTSNTVPVTAGGASFALVLPHRRLAELSLLFSYSHGVVEGDFLILQVSYVLGGSALTTRSRLISAQEMLAAQPNPLGPIVFGFITSPLPQQTEQLHLQAQGKYIGRDVAKFLMDCPLTQTSLLLMITDDAQGGGFHIEAT